MMTAILVTGYKSFEVGIFQDNDERLKIIKQVIKNELVRYFEEGVDWLIFMGNLGFEYWTLEVALDLQKDYDFQIATIFPFENQGSQWSEANQVKLAKFKTVDFVKYFYPTYEGPHQFRQYNQFIVDNTDGAYIFCDSENETNLKYLLQKMSEKENYPINYLTFDKLNDFIENLS
ncbi:DUF1273 domain-containing protein [Streptococcus orisratti]|uniref:DUF1273 domain-containing protein n=1 Tax=Streptococcus orisratti TaxID=114652 RepID=UPI003D04B9D1